MPGTATAAVRGACPSVHQPFAERDGALLRVRLPGGVLTAAQALALAGAAAGTVLELTSRANLQIRGVPEARLGPLVAALVAAGLAPADAGGDVAGEVLLSPGAGLDPTEVVDPRPLAQDLGRRLAAVPGLPAKFAVVVDGGGRLHLRGRRHDLALGALRLRGGEVGYEVRAGEALPVGARDGSPVVVVRPGEAPALVVVAARFVAGGERLADLVAGDGAPAPLGDLAARAGVALRWLAAGEVEPPPALASSPLGIVELGPGPVVAVGAAPRLGRFEPAVLAALAGLVAGGELRLTPWRSILLPGVPVGQAPAVLERLTELGLTCRNDDPAGAVVACAGAAGCPAGLADTQVDGRALIEQLRAAAARPLTVHLSGCPKRCAGRGPHDVTLVAGPEPGTYSLYRRPDAEATDAESGLGSLVAGGLDAGAAVSAVVAGASS